MLTLAFRTDKPEAELYLFEDGQKVGELKWLAHRELAETIHIKIEEILNKSSLNLKDLNGLLVFRGPGSFTGLRIGITVANALAYGLSIPIVGSLGDDWLKDGLQKLADGQNNKIVVPEYGAEPNVTLPNK